jgi:hypothetical protein
MSVPLVMNRVPLVINHRTMPVFLVLTGFIEQRRPHVKLVTKAVPLVMDQPIKTALLVESEPSLIFRMNVKIAMKTAKHVKQVILASLLIISESDHCLSCFIEKFLY